MELVREKSRVDQYQAILKRNFIRNATKLVRTVTGANLTHRCAIHWDKENRVWAHLDAGAETHFWNPFGVDDPHGKQNVVNIVQINPSRAGHLNTGGAFLWDAASECVFLAHSGKLGGKSVGQGEQFLTNLETVDVVVGKTTKRYTIVAEIDDPTLNARIADFVAVAASFKTANNGEPSRKGKAAAPELSGDEYAGKIVYRRHGYVATTRLHGRIFKELKRELLLRGLHDLVHDQNRDLFYSRNRLNVLFEIKTDAGLHQIYTAVGQLMIHGQAATVPFACFLVAPPLRRSLAEKLSALRIGIITYRDTGKSISFSNLAEACKACGVS